MKRSISNFWAASHRRNKKCWKKHENITIHLHSLKQWFLTGGAPSRGARALTCSTTWKVFERECVLYTAYHGERVLVVTRFNATIVFLRPYCEKICTSFLNDAESLTTYGCALWCSQIVYILPYFLNTTTAFYFATECSEGTVFIWGRVHTTILSYFTWPWPGLDSVSCSGCSAVPSVTD